MIQKIEIGFSLRYERRIVIKWQSKIYFTDLQLETDKLKWLNKEI